jgi:hypothetical protein
MSSRVVRGFAAFVTSALVAVSASSAFAQPTPVPVRVIQGSDGTLYVVQGNGSWTLVPDQASDSDVAALNPGGEIDGTLPPQLFVVEAPAAQPAAAQPAAAPAPPAAAPAPAAPAPAAAPVTGNADLTGKAGNDFLTATAIAPGASITSVVDIHTKPADFYSIALSAGTTYTLFTSSKNKWGNGTITTNILNPDQSQAAQMFPGGYGQGCYGTCTFTPATNGTYYIQMAAQSTGQNYTLTFK